MKKNKKREKSQLEEMLEKVNTLALDILDEIIEYRRKKIAIDLENLKAPLLAIKEIKDLVKVNDKIKEGQISDLLNVSFEDYTEQEDLSNVIKLEEVINEKDTTD